MLEGRFGDWGRMKAERKAGKRKGKMKRSMM